MHSVLFDWSTGAWTQIRPRHTEIFYHTAGLLLSHIVACHTGDSFFSIFNLEYDVINVSWGTSAENIQLPL